MWPLSGKTFETSLQGSQEDNNLQRLVHNLYKSIKPLRLDSFIIWVFIVST